jgi:hypothetical protein
MYPFILDGVILCLHRPGNHAKNRAASSHPAPLLQGASRCRDWGSQRDSRYQIMSCPALARVVTAWANLPPLAAAGLSLTSYESKRRRARGWHNFGFPMKPRRPTRGGRHPCLAVNAASRRPSRLSLWHCQITPRLGKIQQIPKVFPGPAEDSMRQSHNGRVAACCLKTRARWHVAALWLCHLCLVGTGCSNR